MSKLLDRFGNPISDGYCTPPWLTALLPVVDLDPASNPRSTVRARRTYSLEKRLDGLKLPWTGSVFLNYPYSDPEPWIAKLLEEMAARRCTSAIVLPKLDSSTEAWYRLTSGQPELWTFDKRIQFDEPPELIADRVRKFAEAGKSGGEKSSNNFCSAIVHHRGELDRGQAPVLDMLAPYASRWMKAA
jgi:hypothetical protein